MAQAFAELEADTKAAPLTYAEWLGLLLDRKLTRRDRCLAARLRYAYTRLPRNPSPLLQHFVPPDAEG
jgi:hypothetical protein